MAASERTPNLQLPIYKPQDQPTYIPTFNDAMTKIDAGWTVNKTNIENFVTALNKTNEQVTAVGSLATQANNTANQALSAYTDITRKIFSCQPGTTVTTITSQNNYYITNNYFTYIFISLAGVTSTAESDGVWRITIPNYHFPYAINCIAYRNKAGVIEVQRMSNSGINEIGTIATQIPADNESVKFVILLPGNPFSGEIRRGD